MYGACRAQPRVQRSVCATVFPIRIFDPFRTAFPRFGVLSRTRYHSQGMPAYLDAKIRELCNRTLEAGDEAETEEALSELRQALAAHFRLARRKLRAQATVLSILEPGTPLRKVLKNSSRRPEPELHENFESHVKSQRKIS